MYKLLLILSLFVSQSVYSSTLQSIVVFGDSLSDNGNLYQLMEEAIPSSPPYYQGRFSNGPVWSEQLAESIFSGEGNAHLEDYAFGGATVNMQGEDEDNVLSLNHEVDVYLQAHQNKAQADSLFVIWIGANNYLSVMAEDDKDLIVKTVNDGIKKNIERLISQGAKHFLLLNLPDLSKTPYGLEFDEEGLLTEYVLAHNQALNEQIEVLKQTYSEADFLQFDVYSQFKQLVEQPQDFGLTNVEEPCYSFDTESKRSLVREPTNVLKLVAHIKRTRSVAPSESCSSSLFFDPIHPTFPAHKLITESLTKLLAENNIVFGSEAVAQK